MDIIVQIIKRKITSFINDTTAWDESSIFAHWRNRPKESNFFSVFNFGVTHESNLWDPGIDTLI